MQTLKHSQEGKPHLAKENWLLELAIHFLAILAIVACWQIRCPPFYDTQDAILQLQTSPLMGLASIYHNEHITLAF